MAVVYCLVHCRCHDHNEGCPLCEAVEQGVACPECLGYGHLPHEAGGGWRTRCDACGGSGRVPASEPPAVEVELNDYGRYLTLRDSPTVEERP